MKKITTTASFFVMGAASLALLTASCNSDADYKTTETAASTQASVDSAAQAQASTDPTLVDATPTTDYTPGIGKANPAKKHGKGQVVYQPSRTLDDRYVKMTIEADNRGIYSRAEVRPSYPGGAEALSKFIQDNIVYPEPALDNGVEGEVEVVFAVDENGKVYTPMIKGARTGYGLDEAATAVVSKMPKWNPGQIKGQNVKSYYTLPINFRIN